LPSGDDTRDDPIVAGLRRALNMRSAKRLHRLADEELLDLVRGADAEAFEHVYDRHSRVAYSLAYRMVGTAAAAQDVVQEAFLSIWRTSAAYDPARGSVRTWILTVVHNRAIDAVRRASVPGRALAADPDAAQEPEDGERTEAVVEQRERQRIVRSALRGLPDDQRQVIELAYFGGFTHTEIAGILSLPLGTVKGRMRLALEKMRAALEPSEALA
jgi:RNA polymerase sigma-70 factor (ECF subfamily)